MLVKQQRWVPQKQASQPRRGQARLRAARGQAILEYVLLFGLVAAAIVGMQVFAKRGIQATLKAAADDMSPFPDDGDRAQIDGMRQDTGESITLGPGSTQRRVKPGDVVERFSSVTTTERGDTTVGARLGGGTFTDYGGGATTTTTGSSSATVVSEMGDE